MLERSVPPPPLSMERRLGYQPPPYQQVTMDNGDNGMIISPMTMIIMNIVLQGSPSTDGDNGMTMSTMIATIISTMTMIIMNIVLQGSPGWIEPRH